MKNSQPVIPDGDPDVESSVSNFIHQLTVPAFRDRLTAELEALYEQQKAALDHTESLLRMVRANG
ncbi:hypothetical protein ACFK5S_000819 [Salmonella enterica subsp. enterica serovar Saintpaul]|uniref:hypothetical protein n=1 Tax=Citrobacter TaxID=544 RepID=UPI000A416FC4|nr:MULTISPECIES: hypothetical protein [Citrobacter]EHF7591324.1 hypothetical protein [Salmonella enterica]EKV4071778.1 hypothetical protein [Citrobacter freundii]EHF7633270.1 hypothetical protein [Salmonella enterica]EIF5923980.1 hypothetical protein [Salmonella enterica]EIF8212245.1 hypothetical protein [Salmonella enterica]